MDLGTINYVKCGIEALIIQRIIIWALERYCSPVINQDTRSAPLLIFAHRFGLYLQSDVLSIPPQFGIFTPSPSALQLVRQVQQAHTITAMVWLWCIFAVLGAQGLVYDMEEIPWRRVLRFWAAVQGFSLFAVVVLWVTACYDYVCRPNYPWPRRVQEVECATPLKQRGILCISNGT
ncbi:hypothetical protein ANO14919_022150 [Xylariales sp. No.14919]|nr:hypothetical protein ANO14919_022150 [Xylariales sp. No.14919]